MSSVSIDNLLYNPDSLQIWVPTIREPFSSLTVFR